MMWKGGQTVLKSIDRIKKEEYSENDSENRKKIWMIICELNM